MFLKLGKMIATLGLAGVILATGSIAANADPTWNPRPARQWAEARPGIRHERREFRRFERRWDCARLRHQLRHLRQERRELYRHYHHRRWL